MALPERTIDECGAPKSAAPEAWEVLCLSCDPFEGDFGGSGSNDGVLSDKIVKAKVESQCHTCAGNNARGDRVRVRAEVFDGEFMRFRWCEACCRAMAEGATNPDAYEERVSIGQARRAGKEVGGSGSTSAAQVPQPIREEQ